MPTRTDLSKVDIRKAVSMTQYKSVPVMLKCKEHKDDTTSLAVYRDHINCYGCGFKIQRRMEALAYLLGGTVNQAIWQASKYLETEEVEEEVKVDLKPLPKILAVSYQRLLYGYRKDRLPWYYDRGLTDQSITSFGLGHDGTRFCIPVYDNHGNLVTFRYRTDPAFEMKADEDEEEGKKPPKYSGVYQRNDVRLYPEWLIANSGEDFLVVCEGELDAVRVWQEGIPAGTPINGVGNLINIVKLLKPYPHIKKLYIASDMDDAGEKGARELMEEAQRAGYTAVRLTWPRSMGKDITELLEWQGTEYDYELFRDLKYNRYRAA